MELQCKERVDLLEALRKSRKDSKDKGKGLDGPSISSTLGSASNVESKRPNSISSGWIGEGTVPPVSYPDLSRTTAPPLPQRPPPPPRQESEVQPDRSSSATPIYASQFTVPVGPANLPVPPKKASRTPSPDKKGGRVMLTTLRGPKDARKSSKSPKVSAGRLTAPPASSKAAGLAWDSSSKSFVQKPGPAGLVRNEPTNDDAFRRDSTGGNTSSRPESTSVTDSDEPGLFGNYVMRPANRPPPDLQQFDQSNKRSFDMGKRGTNHPLSNGTKPVPDLINLKPPTPPAHEPSPPEKADPGPPRSPKTTKSAVDYPSYRTEFPPTTASTKATAEFLTRNNQKRDDVEASTPLNRQRSPQRKSKPPLPTGIARRPVANSSTPRAPRSGKERQRKAGSPGSNEDNSSSGPEPLEKKKKSIAKSPVKPILSDPAPVDDDKTDEESPEDSESERSQQERIKQIRKNLPKGVDEQAAKQIFNEIVVQGDQVHWGDVAGLDAAKKALKEAVVYPFLRPDLFMGLREPARGMLLFGPPGTGKTMLARAVATESHSTFFAISASSLTSKWLGESEKLVRALFSLAKALAPSIIFVDEIDSLLSSRGGSSEHESTRRIKTEFLIQWSDLQRAAAGKQQTDKEKAEGDASRVLVLAATNMPWAIDEAARRRFVRRQYIPLPEAHVRAEQLRTLLGHQKHSLNKKDIQVLVELTDGMFTQENPRDSHMDANTL